MKKLMIAAAAALAVAGVQAECKDSGPAGSDAAVYVWQFKGKTSKAVAVTETYGGGCVDGGTIGCAIRVPGTLAIQAYTYICDYYCESFDTLLGNSPTQFLATKPWKSTLYNTDKGDAQPFTKIDVAHVIGASAGKYELEGEATFVFNHASDLAETFWLVFAGYGPYNKKTGIVTSVSGNFAGKQTPPRYNGKITKNSAACPEADYWDCQTLSLAGKAVDASVAFGTWSVKYNASYSKKLAANKNWRVK